MKKLYIEVTSLKIELFSFEKTEKQRILPYIFTLFASSLNYHFSLFLGILSFYLHKCILNSSVMLSCLYLSKYQLCYPHSALASCGLLPTY